MEVRNYVGWRLQQRLDRSTTSLFIFYARAKDIKLWVGVRRVEDFQEGTQRIIKESRVHAVTRFLNSDSRNTIPNNILLAFEPNVASFKPIDAEVSQCVSDTDFKNNCGNQLEWGILTFTFDVDVEEHLRPAFIVDGQHRLYGISNFQNEDIPLLVVCLLDAALEEQAFQFIVINNKAVKVPTDNVKAIIANLDEQKLQERLLKAGVKYGEVSPVLRDIDDLPNSPFQKMLQWPRNSEEDRLIPLTAIEQSLRYIRTIFPFFEEDDASITEFFFAVWQAVKNNYPNLWGQPNKFMTKVNLNALNEFILDRLQKAWEFGLVDIFSSEQVYIQVNSIIDRVPSTFWEHAWSIKIQDNANIRKLIKEDLERIVLNLKLRERWNNKLQLPIEPE
ncbi:DGQHR domain-containing protein [Trichocoleus sp. FACHB-591]|uniref:DGQHR domain-containing protein n=1 Tax=Trichocoleus sp. FACHB-591 TaxID=2692872 RepID=UPI001689929F|nr:DGQHR domain-containing protein [Trichocoleus sp. FACHB-591]MBD2094467.1 DGQHR domain-containing protein [Trichocoleus sp. FACHB-591]